jgi:hypothetical protein
MKRGVDFLLEQQNADGVWRYPGPEQERTDLSNTQYALLGLQAANRCGALVPPKVWIAALEYLLKAQESYGRPCLFKGNEVRGRYRMTWTEPALARGWRYIPGETPKFPITGSMTTAGMAGLIICQGELWNSRRFTGELRQQTRRGIRDAMAWLQQHYDVTSNPVERDPNQPAEPDVRGPFGGEDPWYLYYMYGLERAGILGRFRFLGPKDWYAEGAEELLRQQFPQGGWGPVHDTCFALLFLKRATSRTHMPVITPSEQAPRPAAAADPLAPEPAPEAPVRPTGPAAPAK